MDELTCPWCGEEYEPVYGSYDEWLEGHAMECEPFLAEQEPKSGPR